MPEVSRTKTRPMPPKYDWSKVDKNCHVPVKCTSKDCHGCMFCAGGLYACSVCGGGEGSMTSQCPGRRLTETELEKVYAEEVDFFHNQWWISVGETVDVDAL